MSSTDFDVIVVGGGPAGATTAGLLAMAGHRAVVLEREKFPRFHVGESLLPVELSVFERLGFEPEKVPALYKAGADFISERTGESARFLFKDALPGTRTHAWQVERATFDHQLLRCAERHGADVREQTTATEVELSHEQVRVQIDTNETISARYLVDATGRDRLMCKTNRSYERLPGYGLAAVWGHFDNLGDAAVDELTETGNTVVLLVDDKAWGWLIPLLGRRISVGFVSAEAGVVSNEWFDECHRRSPFLQRVTQGAERTPLRMLGDYSYRNTQPYGPRWACIGDASYFLDPVFSSGVAIAMVGAERLADLLDVALRARCEGDAELAAPLSASMQTAYDVFGAVVRSFYHTGLVKNLFFYDTPDPELRAGLISVLAGDVWRDDNKFQQMMLRSRRRTGGAPSPAPT